MSAHQENSGELYRVLSNDISVLETIAQLALENARQQVTYFSRLAALARYGTEPECPDIDRSVLLASIEHLSERYEREVNNQEEALRAAYALREAHRDDKWSRASTMPY